MKAYLKFIVLYVLLVLVIVPVDGWGGKNIIYIGGNNSSYEYSSNFSSFKESGNEDFLSKIILEEIHSKEILNKIKMNQPIEYDHVIIRESLDLDDLLDLTTVYFNQSLKNNDKFEDYSNDGDSFPYYRGSTVGGVYSGGAHCSRAQRIKARLVSSPIKINNSIIESDIDFSNTVFLNPISFENTRIMGNITFDDKNCSYQSIFMDVVNFSGSQFNGTADFDGSYFNKTANFEKTTFKESAYFSDSIFKNKVIFYNSIFIRDCYFFGSEFYRNAIFRKSQFSNSVNFDNCIFSGYADFLEAKFKGRTTFQDSNFTKKADFSDATFERSAYFLNSEFNDDVRFSYTRHHKPAYFAESQFIKSVDFNGSRFDQGIDFRDSKFKGDMYLNDVEMRGFINLTRVKYNILNINWSDDIRLVCDNGPTYLDLIRNFRNLERFEIADNIYFQYRDWKKNQRTWLQSEKYLDILALYTCGYGVRISYTICLGAFLMLVFASIYFLISLRCGVTESSNLNKAIEAFCFSVVILLSAPKELYPLENYDDYAAKIKIIPILERLSGWVLLILLINTLSRLMIRY